MESRQWAVGNEKETRKMIYDHLGLKITSRRISNVKCRRKRSKGEGNFGIRSSEFDIRNSLLIGAEVGVAFYNSINFCGKIL